MEVQQKAYRETEEDLHAHDQGPPSANTFTAAHQNGKKGPQRGPLLDCGSFRPRSPLR
jgi:hypothetical protein